MRISLDSQSLDFLFKPPGELHDEHLIAHHFQLNSPLPVNISLNFLLFEDELYLQGGLFPSPVDGFDKFLQSEKVSEQNEGQEAILKLIIDAFVGCSNLQA
jgi:hypothetical protein